MRICLNLLLISLVAISTVLSVVEESNAVPAVAVWKGKITKYKDLSTNQWKDDPAETTLETDEKREILRLCKKFYPKKDVRNILEANEEETIDNWCSKDTKDCGFKSSVTVYKCLVGEFEAEGLMVPIGCHFLHLYNEQECHYPNEWKAKAQEKCRSQDMVMGEHSNFGMLIPCGIDQFNGVEFVCCNKTKKDAVVEKVIEVEEIEEETLESMIEDLEQYVKPVPKSDGLGDCNRDQFHERREKLEEKHRQQVTSAIHEWEETDKRYNVLKKDDAQQASGMISDAMERFRKTIASLEEQAALEREHLREEQHECTQIEINSKKRQSLKDFLEAVTKIPRNTSSIINTVKKFVRLSQHDRYHNLRFFEHIRKDNAKRAEDMRQVLTDHLKTINIRVNKTINLLYKIPEIAQHYRFILPDWAPKAAVPPEPTGAPTTTVNVEKGTIISPTSSPVPTDPPLGDDEWTIYTTHRPTIDDEDEIEHEHTGAHTAGTWKGPKSPTTFAAIVGLCCGALIVMIVIIVAMVVKKGRSPVTKTVLVDPECSADEDKRHLMNMQRSGYENPTYKFYDY